MSGSSCSDSSQILGHLAAVKSSKKGRIGAHSGLPLPLPSLQPGLACMASMSPLPAPGIHVER